MDVRDVAMAQLDVFENEKLAGKRLLWWLLLLAAIGVGLDQQTIPGAPSPTALNGKEESISRYNVAKTQELLGYEFVGFEPSLTWSSSTRKTIRQ